MRIKPVVQPHLPLANDAVRNEPNIPWVLIGSLVSMLLWPLLAIGTCTILSNFEQPIDFVLLFGGATMIIILPIGFLNPPEWVIAVIFGLAQMLILIFPAQLAARRKLEKSSLMLSHTFQAGFSVAQAGLGLLMLAGRSV